MSLIGKNKLITPPNKINMDRIKENLINKNEWLILFRRKKLFKDKYPKKDKVPKRRKNADHVFHLYVCRTSYRDDLIKYLQDFDVFPGIHYPLPIHLHPAYKGKVNLGSTMSITESIAKEIISLPMYPELKISEAQKIVELVASFYDSYAK